MFSAANALSSVPTQVSVCRDATYDVIGKICSGYGSKPIVDICPRQGTIASDDCHDKLPSWSVVARSCVAREDAVCLLLPSGTWGCVFPSVGCEEIKSANGPTQIPRRKLKRKMQCDSVDNLPTWSSATIQADEAPDVAPDMHDDVETTWFTSETSVIQYEVACLSGAVPQDLKTKPPSLQSPPLSLNLTDAVDKATPETMSVRAESPSASSSTTATMAHSSVDPMQAFVEADQLKQPFRNEDVALHTSSNTPTTQVTQGIQLPTHNNMTPSTNPQPSQDAPTTAKPPLPGQSVAPKPSSPATGDPGGSTPPPSPEEPPTTPKETHSSPAIPHPPSTADFKTPSHYVTIFPPPTPDQSLEPKPQSTPLGDSTHEPKGTPSTPTKPQTTPKLPRPSAESPPPRRPHSTLETPPNPAPRGSSPSPRISQPHSTPRTSRDPIRHPIPTPPSPTRLRVTPASTFVPQPTPYSPRDIPHSTLKPPTDPNHHTILPLPPLQPPSTRPTSLDHRPRKSTETPKWTFQPQQERTLPPKSTSHLPPAFSPMSKPDGTRDSPSQSNPRPTREPSPNRRKPRPSQTWRQHAFDSKED
ncbi:unnamed protein product [Aphanomyces euteiches]